MAAWEVPGLAIAVVRDGKLVLTKGYGIRSLGSSAAVDTETVFPIASCTKSFTAAVIGKLVDRGAVQWNDPIDRYLPKLQFFRAELSERITIRDVLTHRSGLPTANMLWRNGASSSDDIMAALRWLAPVAAPGKRFLYNNNMYLVLGKIVEAIGGDNWTTLVHNELFEPLRMKSTIANSTELAGHQNVAGAHAIDDAVLKRIEPYCPDSTAPAGAIHSNARDMARWLMMHLDGGRFEGRQILSAARIEEMHTRPTPLPADVPAEPRVPRAPISNYGLGWFFNDYQGYDVIEHSGTTTGFVSWVAMIPQERLGLVVLSNQHRTGLNYALRCWILDACLGLPERDWSEHVRTDYNTGWQRLLREAKAEFEANRPPAAAVPRPLVDYVGDYESKLYGRLQVTLVAGTLTIRYGTRFDGQLMHWNDNSFRALFPNPRLDDWLVTFSVRNESITGLRVKESPWAPSWYEDADDLGEFRRV